MAIGARLYEKTDICFRDGKDKGISPGAVLNYIYPLHDTSPRGYRSESERRQAYSSAVLTEFFEPDLLAPF